MRDEALRAHATQVDPDGFWFRVPMEMQQKVWPTEDYELARSLVDTAAPEDDLFAGVRETLGCVSRRAAVTACRVACEVEDANMIELLADNNFGDTRSGGLAGPIGLVIILLLASARCC